MRYKGSNIPPGLPTRLREILRKQDRFLRRVQLPAPQGGETETQAGEGAAKAATSAAPMVLRLGSLVNLPLAPVGAVLYVRFNGTGTHYSTPTVRLKAPFTATTDDLLALVSDGHQWHEFASTSADLACPVVINEEGKSCDPVLRLETDSNDKMIYVDGIGAGSTDVVNLGYAAGTTWDSGPAGQFMVRVGGPAETDTRSLLLVEGRASPAFVVCGGYGPGADPEFRIHTSGTGVEVAIQGDVFLTGALEVRRADINLVTNVKPLTYVGSHLWRFTNTAIWTISSITVPSLNAEDTWPIIDWVNAGPFAITIVEEDMTELTASRRIITAVGNITWQPNHTLRIWYDSTTQRWRILA